MAKFSPGILTLCPQKPPAKVFAVSSPSWTKIVDFAEVLGVQTSGMVPSKKYSLFLH